MKQWLQNLTGNLAITLNRIVQQSLIFADSIRDVLPKTTIDLVLFARFKIFAYICKHSQTRCQEIRLISDPFDILVLLVQISVLRIHIHWKKSVFFICEN